MTNIRMDRDRPMKSARKRALPYERRAQKPGAGIVAPGERPPASAKRWSKLSLAEAKRQGQLEMFSGDLGALPERIAKQENRRLRRAAGLVCRARACLCPGTRLSAEQLRQRFEPTGAEQSGQPVGAAAISLSIALMINPDRLA